MSEFLLNWDAEASAVRKYLSGGKGVMHIVGGAECQPVGFLEHLFEIADELKPSRRVCRIDPSNLLTSTPLGALRVLAECLGLAESESWGMTHVEVVKNVRSTFGDVTIEGVSVSHPYVEAEEVAKLTRALVREVSSARRFDDVLVVFQGCETLTESFRRTYYSSIWKPVLEPLVALGGKVVFQFSGDSSMQEQGQIPPAPSRSIRLPTAFEDKTADELAALALARGWEETAEAAAAFARTIMRVSTSVSEVYAKLVLMDDGERSS